MRQLRKFLHLSARDRALLAMTWLVLAAVRLGLLLLSFHTLRQLLARIGTFLTKAAHPVSISGILWAVNVSSCYMPGGAKCLARALTTQFLLNRQGYSSALRIGVAKDGEGKLEAHAWVEYQGQVVMGNLANLSRFTALPSF